MSKLKIAVQKKGRLSEKSLELLRNCGISIPNGDRKLKTVSKNFPLEVLFLRDDDIPEYVEQGVADIGIVGENELWEQGNPVEVVQKLGFASCRMSLAVPREAAYSDVSYFNNKKVATSYPNILKSFFDKKRIKVVIEKIGGSVEIAPGIGLADGVFDIVSTGSTLTMNGLKEVEQVATSEAVLISSNNLDSEKSALLDKLLFRLQSVLKARENKYILLNAPNAAIPEITSVIPGMNSPTIMPLAQEGWSSLHSVVKEDTFWESIDSLKALGAQGILVLNIEKMIV